MTKKKGIDKKEKETKEKVCEIFEVEKKGDGKQEVSHSSVKAGRDEEKVVTSCGTEVEKPASEEQIRKEKKIFTIVIIVLAGLLIMFFGVLFVMNAVNNFNYEGVKFEMVKEGELIFYKTSIPVTYQGQEADYNFFLRNHPGKLEKKVPIIGNISFKKEMIIDVTTKDLFCDGDWNIAIENWRNLYGILGINMTAKNSSVIYVPNNNEMFLTIQIANSTNINKTGENTYEININNCEILPAAERLMVETFVQNEELNK